MENLLQRWARWAQEPEEFTYLGVPIIYDSMVPDGQVFFMVQGMKKKKDKKRGDRGGK